MLQCGCYRSYRNGGAGSGNRMGLAYRFRTGAGGILASVSRTSMVRRTNGASRMVGGASLMGVSVSPTVLALAGSIGREGKFDLALL